MNAGFLAELKAKKGGGEAAQEGRGVGDGGHGHAALQAALQNRPTNKNQAAASAHLMAALAARPAPARGGAADAAPAERGGPGAGGGEGGGAADKTGSRLEAPFEYRAGGTDGGGGGDDAFLFVAPGEAAADFVPRVTTGPGGLRTLRLPLAPLAYRAVDLTFEKAVRRRAAVPVDAVVRKLGIFRALQREAAGCNALLRARRARPPEEEELGQTRFVELLANGGVAQRAVELLLQETTRAAARADGGGEDGGGGVVVVVDGLDAFLAAVEAARAPLLAAARAGIARGAVSFHPGLGELFRPGARLVCRPAGMEGAPLGAACVQSWYAEDENRATGRTKRRFVLVLEFVVSVGDALVFVAMTDVYPEFHDPSRTVPLKELRHRVLSVDASPDDRALLRRLQQRGEFYASVATRNHFLEYHADAFFPVRKGGGWSSNAARPLGKGGRVMVDVARGVREGHYAVRGGSAGGGGSGDATSDTVKEAIKLFESSKRTGIAVPFRTCALPDKFRNAGARSGERPAPTAAAASDQDRLWMCWPMLVGFSFTARVWGKLLLSMPKDPGHAPEILPASPPQRGVITQQRPSSRKCGVDVAALGGEGRSGNCGYIRFQTQAFEQLVLAEDKKELIRAVARNAGGGGGFDDDGDSDDDDGFEDAGIDVVANKGGASIFLLHGPPGCGKTLTAEAIAELLEKPLYIVTAGDLGISASEVETNLGSVLELCQTWDALVLIDEADVFLEARNSTEIARNALVCVMLRLLEYYSGCLFLSSNRSASSIDAAIASRITVMLGYPKLDSTGRAKVWKNLLELVPAIPIDPATGAASEKILSKPHKASKYRVGFAASDYEDLAERFALNGRQIKNSIVLARALARERRTPLNLSVLHRAVIAVAGDDVTSSSVATNNMRSY